MALQRDNLSSFAPSAANGTIANGTIMVFNNIVGGIPYSAITGAWTLETNKRYLLQFKIRLSGFSNANGFFNFQWVDLANVALPFGSIARIHHMIYALGHESDAPMAIAVVTPSVPLDVRVRCIQGVGTAGNTGAHAQ